MAKTILYNIATQDESGNIIDSTQGEIEVTEENMGEFGTKLVAKFDAELKFDESNPPIIRPRKPRI